MKGLLKGAGEFKSSSIRRPKSWPFCSAKNSRWHRADETGKVSILPGMTASMENQPFPGSEGGG